MQVVAVRLTTEELDALDAAAAKNDMSRGHPGGAGPVRGVRVHPGALKHGVSSEDAIQAAEWSLWIEPLDEDGPPVRELRLGFDIRARLLETVGLVLESGEEMVIHAMPARKEAPRPLAVVTASRQCP